MATHVVGERVVLVDGDALTGWTLPASAPGATLRVAATGRGDVVPATAEIVFAGRALAPPAPAALSVHGSAGSLAATWTRRSRAGWAWTDGGDVPLAEESERYRATLTCAARSLVVETTAPALAVDAATLATLGPGPIDIAVVQIGTVAPSVPATFSFTPGG